MKWQKVKINSFLKEREIRIKPADANKMRLKRLEKIDFSGNIYLAENKQTKTGMILIKKGDLVISGINVEKGALAVYEGNEDILATIHYSSYEYDENKIDIEYLKWFLKSNIFKNILKEQVKGGIKTEIKPKHFLPLKIMLPDINTQKQLAKQINNISCDIEELNCITNKNEHYAQKLRQAILTEAIEGKLSPDSESWAKTILEKIIEEKPRNGYSPKAVNYKTSVKNLTLTSTTSGVFNGNYFKYIDEKIGNDSYLWLKEGDILVQRGNSIEYVGIAAIYTGRDKEYIYPDLMMKFRANEKIISKEYLHLYLISDITKNYFKKNASGTSGSMPKINQKTLLNTPITYPSLIEQKRIVAKIDELMRICDELAEQIKQSKQSSEQLMQSILYNAFNSDKQNDKNIIDIISVIEQRAALSAEIVSQSHNNKKFGAVKLEKILYLCEKHLELELGGQYKKWAAGPHDPDSRYKVEEILKDKKWFEVLKDYQNGFEQTIYNPADNYDQHKDFYNNSFAEKSKDIQNLIDMLKGKSTKECEAIATLYAVWNDLLIENKSFTDSDIISEFKKWDEAKQDFYDSDLYDYLALMRTKNLVPRGRGQKTIHDIFKD